MGAKISRYSIIENNFFFSCRKKKNRKQKKIVTKRIKRKTKALR